MRLHRKALAIVGNGLVNADVYRKHIAVEGVPASGANGLRTSIDG
jgi:hypothetical protein